MSLPLLSQQPTLIVPKDMSKYAHIENGGSLASVSNYDELICHIAHYVYHDEVQSETATLHARMALLDAIGCVIESLATNKECSAMIGPTVSGTVVPNGFKLPGTPYQMDPVKGAFDMSALTRYLDHNDAFPGAEWGHPSGLFLSLLYAEKIALTFLR
jgi:2-methylcitrate dehydratase